MNPPVQYESAQPGDGPDVGGGRRAYLRDVAAELTAIVQISRLPPDDRHFWGSFATP